MSFEVQPVEKIPCNHPVPWLYWCCCHPCAACAHRIDVLNDRWPGEYYLCQNRFEKLHEKCVFCPETANNHPYLCLCFESFCFPGGSIAGSRYVIQQDTGLEDTGKETVFGACVAVCVFLGTVGAFLSVWFDSCLAVQQDFEVVKQHGKTSQCCTATV
mmetsp:Transcript_15598/g.23387  ORF Transcript_15598/g.23387 Transcript_15598/m.23387 type:complete len:158 (+) Transcript_15598:77-550(+)